MGEIFSRDELKQCNKEVLITLFLNLQEQMIEMNGKLDRMAEQLAVARNHRYGRKSEKLDVIDGQLCFNFNEAEALLENIYVVEPVEEDVIPTVVKHKKKKGKRKEALSRLPVETISHTLSEEELTDIFGTDGWKQLPDETYMRVKVEPARYTVEEHHICVYAGKTTDKIVKAFRPKSLLRNSIATPSLVASIMNAKYVNGMPLDRIAIDFRRNEVNISKRAGYHPKRFLGDDFQGYLTCDGYQAYHSLNEKITVSGCFAHARRRFEAALTPLKKEFTKEQLKETVAHQALTRIGILYKVEELIRDKTPEERYKERQKQSRPVVDALFEWLHSMEASTDRSSLIGDAVLYTLNQEVYLRRYLEDGRLSIDNNSAERAIKNFAVGRRNWLFAKSIRGADASAIVYSIVETALLNGLKPYLYLTYVLEKLPQAGPFPKPKELDRLLPWSNELPKELRTKIKSKK